MNNKTLFLIIIFQLLISNTQAGTARVGINGATCSYATIVAALQDAVSGDTIYIEPGLYNELLGTIDGLRLTFVPATLGCRQEQISATSISVIIDGGGGSFDAVGGLVEITNRAVVTFRHMMLRSAFATDFGGIIAVTNASTLTLDDAIVVGGYTNGNGGNIYVAGDLFTARPSTLILINDSSVYRGEATLGNGGAIALNGSILTIDDGNIGISSGNNGYSVAVNNGGGVYAVNSTVNLTSSEAKIAWNLSANYGGGLYAINSTVNLTGAIIHNNQVTFSGGGMYLDNTTLTMDNSDVRNNSTAVEQATQGGGGLYLASGSTANISNSRLTDNSSANLGGAVLARSSEITIQNNSIINNNTARIGGGLYGFFVTKLTLNNSIVSGNAAFSFGGGIRCDFCLGLIVDSEILNNSATAGGGVYISESSTLASTYTIKNSVISMNNASSNGGGVYAWRANIDVINSEISQNNAQFDGGGMYLKQSNVTIKSLYGSNINQCNPFTLPQNNYCSEVSGNTAGFSGGAIFVWSDNNTSITSELFISGTRLDTNDAEAEGSALYVDGTGFIVPNVIDIQNALITNNGNSTDEYSVLEAEGNSIISIDSTTIANNFGSPLWIDESSVTATLSNSILYQNSVGPFVNVNTPFTRNCNNAQTVVGASQSMGGNLGNPIFVTTPRGPYRLSSSSPSRNACVDGPFQDMDGLYRPDSNGGTYDQGAFERGGVLVLPEEIFANGFEE